MRDPRLKILYLVVVAAAIFTTSSAAWLLSWMGAQVVLWFVAGLGVRDLARSIRKLLVFLSFIVLSYALFGASDGDRIHPLWVAGLEIPVNLSGAALGLLRSTRIVTLILASQIVQRTGSGADFVDGLRGLRVPDFLAYGLDLVLVGLGPGAGRGGGSGGGGGGGRGRHKKEKREEPGFEFRRLLRGDTGALVDVMRRHLADARRRADGYGLPPETTHDLVVVGGLGLVAMSLRFLKLAPGLPFAPGHKGLIVIPLYLCAHTQTKGSFGATRFGLVVGVLSFFLGMGKFGPFDILRHLGPGLFVDLCMPVVTRLFRAPGVWVYAIVGMGAAGARVLSLVVAAWFVEVPPAFYAMLVPMLLAQMTFGFLSGFVTAPLLRATERLAPAIAGEVPDPPARVG